MSKCVWSKFQETQASEKPTHVWEGVSRIVARAGVGREWGLGPHGFLLGQET